VGVLIWCMVVNLVLVRQGEIALGSFLAHEQSNLSHG